MKEIFVLISNNFRDESEYLPIAASENKDFLIKKIPKGFRFMPEQSKAIPTYMGENANYYEIRTVEFLIKE